jgi:hypothetical protein
MALSTEERQRLREKFVEYRKNPTRKLRNEPRRTI